MTLTQQTTNKAGLAKLFNVSTVTLDRWLQAGLPYEQAPGSAGKSYVFDVPAVIQWRIEREAGNNRRDDSADELRRRKLAAEAEIAEMEAAQRAGRLLQRDEVDAAVIGAFARVRARLLGVPQKVAPLVAPMEEPGECEVAVRSAIYDCLRELSETNVQSLSTEETRHQTAAGKEINDGNS